MSKYFEIKFLVVFSLLSALFLQADAQNGMIDSLRLANSETGNVITSISMNTDSSLSIKMQVVWSDDAAKTWVDGTGTWKLSPDTIKWDANPPSEGSSWNINPKTPGNENLTVTSGSVSKVIPITITPASPSRISIQLASPADSIIAGRPFKIVVEMWNVDGLVPGVSCSTSVTVTDALGNGTKTAIPTMVLSGNATPIPLGTSTVECFNTGLDTITVTLYNAPMSLDSMHQISVVLTDQTDTMLKISTAPFHLYPGPTISFKLEYANGNPIQGPDTLYYPDGAVNIYARGYDQCGNLIGSIRCSWTQSGTLHPLTPPTTNQINVYYDASNSIYDEAGWIKATVPSGIGADSVSDSVRIIILHSAKLIESVHKNRMEKYSVTAYKSQIVFSIRPDLTENSRIKIQNLSGKLIADFQGSQRTIWNCKSYSAGLYIAQIYLKNALIASVPVVLSP